MRGWLLALLLLAATPVAAQQSLPSAELQPVVQSGLSTLWECGFNALAATLTQCQAAPAAGLKLYVTRLVVQTTTATSGTYALQSGTGANCVTATAGVFPSTATANRFNAPIASSAMAWMAFNPPLVLPAASALCVVGVATNTVSGQIAGFTAP